MRATKPKRSTGPDPATVARALLGWFPDAARDMPWRRTLDPYAVWVSEIMLQQTQVRTATPYWERWMRELPTVRALADAADDLVLRLWEGLGYYSRARNLHKAARQIAASPGGTLPADLDGLLALPGIGRYTAGAIASIAFGLPAPILDGNVVRVLSRLHALRGNPKARANAERIWDLSGRVVAAAAAEPPVPTRRGALRFSGNCSVANQALMELGATVCTTASPRCDACPLATACVARARGTAARFPETAARPTTITRRFATVVWQHGRRWLVRRRPADGVNRGFWEWPNLELGRDDDARAVLARWIGVPSRELVAGPALKRSITHQRITEETFRAGCAPGDATVPEASDWVTASELEKLPMVAAHRRLVGRG